VPSDFVLPGLQAPQLDQAALLTQRGTTEHFVVSYDESLGSSGPTLSDAVLQTAEGDYQALQQWFGGITPANLPFNVNIVPGSGGASHASCATTTLNCDAFDGTNADLVRMLVVAEADEVFMDAQGAGWDCGASNGEGLSRVLAAERYPAQLDGFASAASWLNSDRPDFVTSNDSTDTNYVSIGCSTLFINYLRFQLGHALTDIVTKGGPTLQSTFGNLTGSTASAFADFSSLLATRFPPGQAASLADDNPFPITAAGP
jgi:hypothetical protein